MPVERAKSEINSALIDGIADWLVAKALGETTIDCLL